MHVCVVGVCVMPYRMTYCFLDSKGHSLLQTSCGINSKFNDFCKVVLRDLQKPSCSATWHVIPAPNAPFADVLA